MRTCHWLSLLCCFAVAIPHRAAAQSDQSAATAPISSFEMAWPQRQSESVVARARAAVEAMTGRTLRSRLRVLQDKSGSAHERVAIRVPAEPMLEVRYLPRYDELRITDTELAVSTAPTTQIPEEQAVAVAKRLFDELVRRKLVAARPYNWDHPDIAATMVGGGSLDGKTVEPRRVEYRITARRTINGIEVANAGVRIAVHVSGRVSALRLGGVVIASKEADGSEMPVGRGRRMMGRVAAEDLQARIERELAAGEAKVEIAWSRPMYVMPENRRRAVVAPMQVVSYSLRFPGESGESVVSRRKTVGFSLVDPAARPVDLTPPVRAPRMERERKKPRQPMTSG
jgi:hypothetical protein